ncbi:hypothetical protein O3P69_020828 [Scylla paramamosain]|uniref:Uncharacterized protein n=1 Tax=Scylla paramamosain TaxID=85552 RepID=A0AAW0TP87_SCYPA
MIGVLPRSVLPLHRFTLSAVNIYESPWAGCYFPGQASKPCPTAAYTFHHPSAEREKRSRKEDEYFDCVADVGAEKFRRSNLQTEVVLVGSHQCYSLFRVDRRPAASLRQASTTHQLWKLT